MLNLEKQKTPDRVSQHAKWLARNLPTDLLYHNLMVGNWQWGINTDLN
jgi:hypothetical protein